MIKDKRSQRFSNHPSQIVKSECVRMHTELNYGVTAISNRTGTNKSLVRKWLIQQGVYRVGGRSKSPIEPRGNSVLKILAAEHCSELYLVKSKQDYWSKHPSILTYNYVKRYNTDPSFMIQERIRRRISKLIKHEAPRSSATVRKYCGVDTNIMRQWIESQFVDGMGWHNYGSWELDHVKPCCSFDLSSESEAMKCFHYTNYQPLWWYDNAAKSSAVVTY